MIEKDEDLKSAIDNSQMLKMKNFLMKCKNSKEEIDIKNKMQVKGLFNGKKVQKMS